MQAVFLLLSFLRRGGVVILKQGGSVMLNLPALDFSSLCPKLPAFILYFYPNYHFCLQSSLRPRLTTHLTDQA